MGESCPCQNYKVKEIDLNNIDFSISLNVPNFVSSTHEQIQSRTKWLEYFKTNYTDSYSMIMANKQFT